MLLAALAVAVAGGGAATRAHGLGMSQLRLRLDGARAEGEWEVQVQDARRALGLDPPVAGEVSWRELTAREPSLRQYLKVNVHSTSYPASRCLPFATQRAEPAATLSGIAAGLFATIAARSGFSVRQ